MQETGSLRKGSQTFAAAVLLTLAGGCLDAYTYYARGGVFANAQTGNIIKLGLRIGEARFDECVRYLIPIAAFILGTLTVLAIENAFQKRKIRYIRRAVLTAEIASFAAAAFVPAGSETDIIANTLVSFGCAMQMQAFRSFGGEAFATTVSTGNLRKAVEYLYKGMHSKKTEDFASAVRYIIIVSVFIGGVILGAVITPLLGAYSSLVPAGILAAALVLISVRYRQILQTESRR